MPIQSTNPATGAVLRSFTALDEAALKARIAQATAAAALLRATPLEHRALCLRKLATLLVEDKAELADTITLETGTPKRDALAEILRCAEACRYYAEAAARMLAPEPLPSTGAGRAYLQYSPMGVVLAVLGWHGPLWQAFRFLAPALMGGNVCLLRHAPTVPQCSMLVESLVRRAGFVRGAVTALLIENRDVEAVLGDDRVVAVTVTGSEAVGRAVAAQAGWLLKKSVLHLGGSDPFVVMPTANLDKAVAAAVAHGGTAKRIIVHADVYTDFLHRFVAAVDAVRVGDPAKDNTEIGPLGTADALKTLEEQIKSAVAAGGRVVTGGSRLVGAGNYFENTVLSDVPRTSPVYRDEIVGPVALVFRARDLADALSIANDTPYGLGASVWTEEPSEQQQLITGVDAGTVALNAVAASDARLPFGGTKRSGYGRELGAAGMREFLNAKTVYIG